MGDKSDEVAATNSDRDSDYAVIIVNDLKSFTGSGRQVLFYAKIAIA